MKRPEMALLKAMFEFLSFGHTIFQHRSGLKRLNLVNLINFGPTVYLPTYCWSWNLVKLKINFQILHSLCFMSSLLLATIFSLSFSFSLRFCKKWAIPGLFLFISVFFKQTTIFTTNQCEKCPSSAGIRTHYLQNVSPSHNH